MELMLKLCLALVLPLLLVLLQGPRVIPLLHKLHFGQTIYELGPQTHKNKQGTPVMGGLMMALGILLGSLICHPAEWDGIWDYIFPLLFVSACPSAPTPAGYSASPSGGSSLQYGHWRVMRENSLRFLSSRLDSALPHPTSALPGD